MDKDPQLFSDWIDNMTVSDVINLILMISFTLVIIYFVAKAFKEDPES